MAMKISDHYVETMMNNVMPTVPVQRNRSLYTRPDETNLKGLFYDPADACRVCGHVERRYMSYFCSDQCEWWLISEYRRLALRDFATVMQGRRLKSRGDQVLAWN